MSLTSGQIPKVANVPNGGVGVIEGSSNTVALGSNINGTTVYTAGASGGRVMSLTAVTDDSVAVNVFVYIYRGSTVIDRKSTRLNSSHEFVSRMPSSA